MPKKPGKPHDEFFKASFGRKDVAMEYLQSMLPLELCNDLDLERLERVNGSFVFTQSGLVISFGISLITPFERLPGIFLTGHSSSDLTLCDA